MNSRMTGASATKVLVPTSSTRARRVPASRTSTTLHSCRFEELAADWAATTIAVITSSLTGASVKLRTVW